MNTTHILHIRLTAAATRGLPRWLLLVICVIYGLSGLFSRNPWKNEDVAGFDATWTLAIGSVQDWLMPSIARRPVVQSGLLVFQTGGAFIHLLGQWFGPTDASRPATALFFFATSACIWYGAYLLSRRPEAQPFEFVFSDQSDTRDYGRTLADDVLLILLACIGLAQRGYETTLLVGALCFVTTAVYGLIRMLDRPMHGSPVYSIGVGHLSLADDPILSLATTVVVLIAAHAARILPLRPLLIVALPVSIVLGCSWPAIAYLLANNPTDAVTYVHEQARFDRHQYAGLTAHSLGFITYNLPLFARPVWPLVVWAWKSWGGIRIAPHITLPLVILLPQFVLLLMQPHPGDDGFLLLIPSMAVTATFALPTLKHGVISAIDWLILLAFTISSSMPQLLWIAKMMGFPPQLTHNVYRIVSGYRPEFGWTTLVCALFVTVAWALIVVWHTSRTPEAAQCAVVISAAGTTFMWVLMVTLQLSTTNYAKTYRNVAQSAALVLSHTHTCAQPTRMDDAQPASFVYFSHTRFDNAEDNCDILLRHDPYDYGAPTSASNYE